MNTITKWTRNHSLFAYFILAYFFSWIIAIPLALQARGVIQTQITRSLHYLIAYGPMLAALMVTGLTSGTIGLQKLWSRMTKWRIKPGWWLVAVSPLGIYLLAGTALWALQGQKMNLATMGQIDYLPPLGLAAIPLWILTFGIGEETGWRGFALPRLQKGRSALSATLWLWIFWALWHLPLFFYTYDPAIIPGMLIGLLAGAITFTWLYNSTGGSVLMTAIWHGLFNYTTACVSCQTGTTAAIISTLVMVWAVAIVVFFKPDNLSRAERQTL
jgi:membrane protease YdiL (CAAX protease family)